MIPLGEQVPAIYKHAGQNWLDASERCYKCQHFASNMPMTGRCQKKQNNPTIVSGDFSKGDWCSKFELKQNIKSIMEVTI